MILPQAQNNEPQQTDPNNVTPITNADPSASAPAAQAQPPVDPLDALVDEIDSGNPAVGSHEPQAPQQPQQEPQAPQEPQPLEPPKHWPEDRKELFKRQTPEAQQFLLDRHREMEADYTRKTQTLSEQAQAVAGLQGLGARLQQDPAFREHLQSYFQQQAQPQAQPQSGKDGEIDPIDQIKNDAAEMAYARIKKEQTYQAQQAQQHDFQQAYSRAQELNTKDPLHEKVKARLDDYVQAQKHPIRIKETYAQLDSNPFFYLEMYRVMREEVVAEQQLPQQQGQQQPQGQRTVTTRVPNLERGGGAPHTTTQSEARKTRADRKKEALRSGTTEALGEFLDSAGLIDSLL